MYKWYLVIVITIVFAVAGIFIYLLLFSGTGEVQLDSYATQDELYDRSHWLAYENQAFDFTFSYPPHATATTEAESAKITYLGPASIPNSEITDGFTFYVRTEDHTDQSLQDFAQNRFTAETEQFGAVTQLSSSTADGSQTYAFQARSALGPVISHVIKQADDDTAFLISFMIADPDARGYDKVVAQMIGSLALYN